MVDPWCRKAKEMLDESGPSLKITLQLLGMHLSEIGRSVRIRANWSSSEPDDCQYVDV